MIEKCPEGQDPYLPHMITIRTYHNETGGSDRDVSMMGDELFCSAMLAKDVKQAVKLGCRPLGIGQYWMSVHASPRGTYADMVLDPSGLSDDNYALLLLTCSDIVKPERTSYYPKSVEEWETWPVLDKQKPAMRF